MNPVLVFLILIGGFLLWLICSFLYKPIGRFFGRLADDAIEAMTEVKDRIEKTENNEEFLISMNS